MNDVTVRTLVEKDGSVFQRNVTLWLEKDRQTVTLLGNLPHGTTIVVDQHLVNELQALVNTIDNKPKTYKVSGHVQAKSSRIEFTTEVTAWTFSEAVTKAKEELTGAGYTDPLVTNVE